MSGILPHLVISLLYTALAGYLWQTRWHPPGDQNAPVLRPAWEGQVILLPLALHAVVLYQSIVADGGVYLGVGNALSTIAWLAVLIYWLGNFFYRLDGLQLLVTPLAALGALAPLAFPSIHPLANTGLAAFKIHLLISMLAYGLFTIASLHVLLMALQEKWLHGGASSRILQNLPPLLTMEALLFRVIGAGFLFLTLTVASGILFSEELFGKPLQFSHKTIFALISWGIFAALLGGRMIYGWRGKIAVRWTLVGFLALFLAYIGSKFVVEVILHR